MRPLTPEMFFNWFLQVFVPYALLVTAFLNVKVGYGRDRFGKAFDIGLDAYVLGVGIAAVLLSGPGFKDFAPVISLVVGFILLPVFNELKKSKHQKFKFRASIA